MIYTDCIWARSLTDEQQEKLDKVISKIPGFPEYITSCPTAKDLRLLIATYKYVLLQRGRISVGISANLRVVEKIYKDIINAGILNNDLQTIKQDNINSVIQWNPRPKWSLLMDKRDLDYLDHFIPQVTGLADFLRRTPNRDNLNDLIDYFEREIIKLNPIPKEITFILDTIKLSFGKAMDKYRDALLYINKNLHIDDSCLLKEYHSDAILDFYSLELSKEVNYSFIQKYAAVNNPYIACDIAKQFANAKIFNESLHFLKNACIHIFSSPNIYWNNAEAIYGCANALNILVQFLGNYRLNNINTAIKGSACKFLESFYLTASRVLHWDDKETFANETYGDQDFPINIEHKLQFYRVRSKLILEVLPQFGLLDNHNYDTAAMALSDLIKADQLAQQHNVVGVNSVYKRDAEKIFHEYYLFKQGDINNVSEKGRIMNLDYEFELYKKYRRGLYTLSQEQIASIFYQIKHPGVQKSETTPIELYPERNLEEEIEYSTSYKKDADKIRKYLIDHNIRYFYHFTDASKIDSIRKNGGLLSSKKCLDEGISIPVRTDMAESRDIDAKKDLENYARLSFCKRLPKLYQRLACDPDADFVLLYVDIEVALFEETMFTDKEATLKSFNCGKELEDLKKVNMDAVQKEICPTRFDIDYWDYQAEVLVKGYIPSRFIVNLDNPEKL